MQIRASNANAFVPFLNCTEKVPVDVAVLDFLATERDPPLASPSLSLSLLLSEEDESPYPPNKLPSAVPLPPPSSLLLRSLHAPPFCNSAGLGWAAFPGGSGRFFNPTWNLVFGRSTGSATLFTGADERAACCAAANAFCVVESSAQSEIDNHGAQHTQVSM